MNRSADGTAHSGLAGAGYFIAFLLIVVSLLDYFAAVWPFQLSEASWRYGAVGLLSNFLLTPLLGLFLASWIAATIESRGTLRALSMTSLIAAVAGILALAAFLLDTLQVRRSADAQLQGLTAISATKAALKMVPGVIALVWLGLSGLKVAKGMTLRGPSGRKNAGPDGPIVVGGR